ncbi:MAG: CsgG/HfaB family protein [Alphaproteobacteria bacterium]
MRRQKSLYLRSTAFLTLLALATACSSKATDPILQEPIMSPKTTMVQRLEALPAPARMPVVAVYEFQDQTGQHKPSDNKAEYSRAVTQGAVNILVKALVDAGQGKWFTVIERSGLQNLLQERQIIRATRDEYADKEGKKLPMVGPLLNAGVILEGGVVSYESNTVTGGAGARYLGIGLSTQYRQDEVTVYLRAVSVQSGKVLASVNTTKTIYSASANASIYRYVALDKIFEAETGFSHNEPPQFALRQAIELAVYGLIIEGTKQGLWEFADKAKGAKVVGEFDKKLGAKPVESASK